MKLLAILASAFVCASAISSDFTGEYTANQDGATVRLSVKQDKSGAVTASLADGTDTLSLKGRLQGDLVRGTCVYDGETLQFKLAREAGKVVFTLFVEEDGEVDEILKLAFDAKPTGGGKPNEPTPATGPAKPAETPAKPANASPGQSLPWGASFSAPKGWSAQASAVGMLLVPPAAKQSERYFFPVVAVPGGTRADGADFSEAIKAYVQPYTTGMSVVADKPLSTKLGPGRLVAFEGSGSRLHVYATVHNGLGIGVIGIGSKADILARAETLGAIFSSFAPGKAAHDPALAGAWSIRGADFTKPGGTQGYGRSTRRRTVQLAPDGRYVLQFSSRTVISGDGFHADSGDNVNTTQGRWFAANGLLILVTGEGDPGYFRYQLTGDGVLRVTDSEGSTELYQRG